MGRICETSTNYKERAGTILVNSTRKASASAKRNNPRLKRVKKLWENLQDIEETVLKMVVR